MRYIFRVIFVGTLLAGCGLNPANRPDIDLDVEEAANDMEESKLDYESCLKDQEDEPEITCDDWKEIYEDDRDAYERLVKEKKAKLKELTNP